MPHSKYFRTHEVRVSVEIVELTCIRRQRQYANKETWQCFSKIYLWAMKEFSRKLMNHENRIFLLIFKNYIKMLKPGCGSSCFGNPSTQEAESGEAPKVWGQTGYRVGPCLSPPPYKMLKLSLVWKPHKPRKRACFGFLAIEWPGLIQPILY